MDWADRDICSRWFERNDMFVEGEGESESDTWLWLWRRVFPDESIMGS